MQRKDPPTRLPHLIERVVEAANAWPGEWVQVQEYAGPNAWRAKRQVDEGLREYEGEWEVVAAAEGEGSALYVRWTE